MKRRVRERLGGQRKEAGGGGPMMRSGFLVRRLSTSLQNLKREGRQLQSNSLPNLNAKIPSDASTESTDDSGGFIEEFTNPDVVIVHEPERAVGESLVVWAQSTQALVQSPEMSRFLRTSRNLALDLTSFTLYSAGVTMNICFLPVTLPLHVATKTTNFVVGNCVSAVTGVPQIKDENDDDRGPLSHVDAIVHHVGSVVPHVLNAAVKVKDDIGGMLLGFVFGRDEAAVGSAEQKAYLERLRLDDFSENAATSDGRTTAAVSASSFDVSKYLLRVDEFDIRSDTGERVLYIDLSREYADDDLTSKGLDSFVMGGFALVSNGAGQGPERGDWKPEGKTKKFLQMQPTMTPDEWYDMMKNEVFVWSGSTPANRYSRDAPVFLSRGFLPGSPRAVFNLLWDSSKTTTYNKFCVARSDALIIVDEDDESDPSNDFKSIKIVKNETKIPLTSATIKSTTLMYASRFEDGSYLVVSRSLTCGAGGHHTASDRLAGATQNEVTWGVNWVRVVPGKPGVADLISASQICSNLVPRFLTQKVGLMAVDTAFQSLRSLEILNDN